MKMEIIDNFLSSYQADSYVKMFGSHSEFLWMFVDDLNESSYL